MMKFAKLFETDEFGQLLVIRDSDDGGNPCVRLMFNAPRFDALATMTESYPDTDEGFAEADHIFAEATCEWAKRIVGRLSFNDDAPVLSEMDEE